MDFDPPVFPQKDHEEKLPAAAIKRHIGWLMRAGSTIMLRRSRRQASSCFCIEPSIIT
jgi:hypothetical protein